MKIVTQIKSCDYWKNIPIGTIMELVADGETKLAIKEGWAVEYDENIKEWIEQNKISFEMDANNLISRVLSLEDELRMGECKDVIAEIVKNLILKYDNRYEKLLNANQQLLQLLSNVRSGCKMFDSYLEIVKSDIIEGYEGGQ